MSYETLELDVRDGGIATLTMNRPDQLNALNEQVIDDLTAAVDELSGRDDVRVLVVTGKGRAFVAGADIKQMHGFEEAEAKAFADKGHAAMDALSKLPYPVIAAVNGFALGGGLELALACDLIYASDKARLGLPEVGLGIIPGFGGTQRLGRTIGWHHARELVFSGRHVKADEALRMGLVCAVFPAEEFIDKVYALAEKIAANGPVAVRVAKRVMREGSELPLDKANALERDSFGELFMTDDRSEGMQAFLEKREANFTGK
ncbi:enoyl-CoA hydratase/isomerase family protein [Persicimonas caeni]|uniref:Enoyl-CoA hydratase/isomerase family protein n=1 Tax=Persicimonas caeni TaxID=2292766 RepID=A0A4Y6Q3E7_PERCE|nr:enoyl-CoA hydratase-related protein [Persicimonas caeni]QDG54687.1 enoyl-CoA hydratase/isomerase family protein [Persicimonas caeni]QED35908.1 enoyl-CoA hydratase/isomerase family protein [Persicimonas caeni]